jgi:hypothetical protein
LIHGTVARGAAYALVDVNAVVEINVVGQTVHSHPLDGLIGAEAFADRLKIRRIIKEHGMAVHAGFCGRDAGKRGGFDTVMTVTAVNAIVTGVVFVAELHGLNPTDALVCNVGRPGDDENHAESQIREDHQGKYRKPRD